MKILAFSDLHLDRAAATQIVSDADEADVVLGVGDFAQRREGLAPYMQLLEPIASKAIYVAGNNESVDELRDVTSAAVLHGNSVDVAGLTIAGIGGAIPPLPPLPWQSYDITEEDADRLLDRIGKADILLSHSPPFGVADKHLQLGSIGAKAVYNAAKRLQPQWLLCGHIHDAWGETGMIGKTKVQNLGPAANWIEVFA